MPKTTVVKLKCKSADEAESIQRALDQPEMKAFLAIVGTLMPLGDRGRKRVLEYFNDLMDETNGHLRIETTEGRHHITAMKAVEGL